jgi:hypothetical protein
VTLAGKKPDPALTGYLAPLPGQVEAGPKTPDASQGVEADTIEEQSQPSNQEVGGPIRRGRLNHSENRPHLAGEWRDRFSARAVSGSRRSSPKPDRPPTKPATYTFRANDGEFDRYQDRLSVSGLEAEGVQREPGHSLQPRRGRRRIPRSRSERRSPDRQGPRVRPGRRAHGRHQFDQKPTSSRSGREQGRPGHSERGQRSLHDSRRRLHENEKGGLDSTAQELLEISIVTIPGNQRALRVKGLDGDAESSSRQIAFAPRRSS